MDVLEIDGASNRGIDEIRDLRENVKYTPSASRFKIIIIDEVHMLTREAFNALLKTLEEPPEHVKFILATTEAHKVPVTIVSRCQRYDFKRISFSCLRKTLEDLCSKENIEIESQTLDVLAKMADGGMRDGLSLLDQVIAFSGSHVAHDEVMALLGRIDPDLLTAIFAAIADGDAGEALRRFNDYMEKGGDEAVLNREMMEIARDIMAGKLGAEMRQSLPPALLNAFSIDQLERIFKVLLDLELAFRNSEHPRLIMDVALVKMCRIRSLIPIETLIAQFKAALDRNPDPAPKPSIASYQHLPNPKTHRSSSERQSPTTSITHERPRPNQKAKETSRSETNPPDITSMDNPPSSPTQRSIADNPGELLQKIIEALPPEQDYIQFSLRYGTLIQHAPDSITIHYHPNNKFHMDRIANAENRTTISAVVDQLLGHPSQIRFVLGDDATPLSPIEQEEKKKEETINNRMKLATDQPIISQLIQTFNASIRDIQTKNNTQK